MSLADLLVSHPPKMRSGGAPCPVAKALETIRMSDAQGAEALEAKIMAHDWADNAMSAWVADHTGLHIPAAGVGKHRRRECRCESSRRTGNE